MNSSVFDSDAYSGALSKPFKAFDAPDWATGRSTTRIQLGPTGPVAPEEFVNADGSCPPEPAPSGPAAVAPPAQPVAAAPPTDPARMERLEPDGAAPPMPTFNGGVALGMTECQVVRRAGSPSNISIGADEKGTRKVVLSYLGGNSPGIYEFQGGRLKEISAAPVQEKPTKQQKKKQKTKPPKAATRATERVYVQ